MLVFLAFFINQIYFMSYIFIIDCKLISIRTCIKKEENNRSMRRLPSQVRHLPLGGIDVYVKV